MTELEVTTEFRNKIKWSGNIQNGIIKTERLEAIGHLRFLELAAAWKSKLNGPVEKLEVPTGHSPQELILKELILKLQGRWNPPYTEHELCHCRSVATRQVEEAIIYGAHTVDAVADRTGAGTVCTTCRPNTEQILQYILSNK